MRLQREPPDSQSADLGCCGGARRSAGIGRGQQEEQRVSWQTGGWAAPSHASCTCPFVCRACRAPWQKTPRERPALPQWPRHQSTCAIEV